MTYDDGEGSPKVVQKTPFSCQLLCIAQLGQSSFILNLEVDLGRRHGVGLVWLCGTIVNVACSQTVTSWKADMLIALRSFLLGSFRGESSLPNSPTRGKNEFRGGKEVKVNNSNKRGGAPVKHGTCRASMPSTEINGTTHVSRRCSPRSCSGSSLFRKRKVGLTHQYDRLQRATAQHDLIILPREPAKCRGWTWTWGHTHDALADEALQTSNAPHGCHLPHRMAPAVVYTYFSMVYYQVQGGWVGWGLIIAKGRARG